MESSCPRCGGVVAQSPAEPTGMPVWRCPTHGVVAALHELSPVTPAGVTEVGAWAQVPMWAPDPLPPGWALTAVAWAGNGVAAATAMTWSGPAPLGGEADLVIVAEEPGTGLGAGFAALPGPDPGTVAEGPPHATVRAAGHATPLWSVPTLDDRCAYVGEAAGVWLWAVLWPASAGWLLVEDLVLTDLGGHAAADLPVRPTMRRHHPGV